MKLRPRPRRKKTLDLPRYSRLKKQTYGAGQYDYDHDSLKSESFAMRDFILPPTSIPQSKHTLMRYRQGKRLYRFDMPPLLMNQNNRLTPELIDRLYEHVMRTHSIDCAAAIYCIPAPTISQWMTDGKKYAEQLMRNEPPNEGHIFRYILYVKLMQAKAMKQSEKRARLMREVPDRDWFRIMNVLDRMEPEDWGNKRGPEGARKSQAEMLGDESYM